MDKQEKEKKKIVYPKKGKNLITQPLTSKHKKPNIFEDQNFQLAGW